LCYLTESLSEVYPSMVDLAIEYHDVDIALLKKSPIPEFSPCVPPILVIEVKRNECNIKEHQSQLLGYMKQLRCYRGVLFNFNEIHLIEIESDDHFISRQVFDLSHLNQYIIETTKTKDNDLECFLAASAGSFEHFKRLTIKFKYSRATFISKEFTAPIEGFIFEFHDDVVSFDVVGHYSKKKHTFNSANFEKLISLQA